MTTASINTAAQITVDSATVHLSRVGGKLVISIDDPDSVLAEVELVDHPTGRSLATVQDPAAESRALVAIAPMVEALSARGWDGAVAMRKASSEDALEAEEALRKAVKAAGLYSYLHEIMYRGRRAADASTGKMLRSTPWPFMAVAYRHLIGSHDYTQEHFEALISGWRAVFGPELLTDG